MPLGFLVQKITLRGNHKIEETIKVSESMSSAEMLVAKAIGSAGALKLGAGSINKVAQMQLCWQFCLER